MAVVQSNYGNMSPNTPISSQHTNIGVAGVTFRVEQLKKRKNQRRH